MKHIYLAILAGLMSPGVQAAIHDSCQFATISNETTRASVMDQFGQPDRVTGSGLSIDVYKVKDGSEVWVAWMGQGETERLLYVQHVGDVLDTPDSCK